MATVDVVGHSGSQQDKNGLKRAPASVRSWLRTQAARQCGLMYGNGNSATSHPGLPNAPELCSRENSTAAI